MVFFKSRLFFNNIRRYSTNHQSVQLQGWIQKAHKKGEISFIHVMPDATTEPIQIVVPKDVGRNFSVGAAVKVTGQWTESIGPGQEKEIIADKFTLLHVNNHQPVRGEFNRIRRKLHLRAKHPAFATVLKLRSKINFHTHKYFMDKGFCHIDTPLTSMNDCEGAGEAFTIISETDTDFFGTESVYLPVSGQLHLEAVCGALQNVYTLNTAFRAEQSLGRHHMAEFRMLEAECAFVDSLDGIRALVEDYVKFVISFVKNECTEDVLRVQKLLPTTSNHLSTELLDKFDVDRQFPVTSYKEAIKLLEDNDSNVIHGFSKFQEKKLVELHGGPIFVERFPAAQKPFYMRINDDNEAECFDLLFPFVGELAGGSVREYDVDKLGSRIKTESLDWYLQLRDAGYPRSSGFGLGMDRFMQYLFSIQNIKDTIPFPRWFKHYQC